MNLIKQLQWRYATKRMNGIEVPEKKVDAILEAIRLAPSSFGLTPYSVVVIKDKALLKKINASACQQPQLLEGSHLIVFAAWDDIAEKQVDEYMALIAATRGVPVAVLADFKRMIWGTMSQRSQADRAVWSVKQAYIALGIGLAAAAIEEVDATPMEGFDPAKLDEILDLPAKGLKSAVLLMLGYRDAASDPSASAKKVRRAKEDLFIVSATTATTSTSTTTR